MSASKGMRWPGKGIGWKEFFTDLKKEYSNDNVGDVAGNLTFQAMLSLFPGLIFLVALGSLFLTPQNIQQVVQGLGKVAPGAVTQIISERLQALQQGSKVSLLTVSVVFSLWSASGGVVALMRALNTAYDVKEGRPFWKVRGIAVLMTLFAAVVSIVAALAAIAFPAVARHLGPVGTVLTWLRLPIAGVLMMFVWAVLYYFLPDTEQEFRFITPGSVIGVLVWLLASWGFSLYVRNFGKYDATYGALAGVVVLLVWMWISAQVLLVGAEINAVIEHKSPEGKRAGAKRMAEKGADATKSEKAEAQVGEASPALMRQARRSPAPRAQRPAREEGGFAKLRNRIWAAGAALSFLSSRRKATH